MTHCDICGLDLTGRLNWRRHTAVLQADLADGTNATIRVGFTTALRNDDPPNLCAACCQAILLESLENEEASFHAELIAARRRLIRRVDGALLLDRENDDSMPDEIVVKMTPVREGVINAKLINLGPAKPNIILDDCPGLEKDE